MHVLNQFGTHRCQMLTRQVQPMEHGVSGMMFETLQGPQAVAFAQGFQDFDHHVTFSAQRLKERALVRTKGVEAGSAIQALFDMTVDVNIAGIHFGSVRAGWLIAPLPFEFHDERPPRAANDTSTTAPEQIDSSISIHGLGMQLGIFTA